MNVVTTCFSVWFLLSAACVAWLIRAFSRAPHGIEDEHGWHEVER